MGDDGTHANVGCPVACGTCPDDGACDDTDGGATDPYGDGCDDYVDNSHWCGGYDDDDFTSNEMCCACA